MAFAVKKCRITLQIAVALASFQLLTSQSISWDSTCGTSKGCFPECTTGCKFLVTWYTSGSVTYFDLQVEESNVNVYLAIGFSEDRRMGDDSVVSCIVPGNSVQMNYNDGTNSEELSPQTTNNLHIQEFSQANGVIHCKFIRNVIDMDKTHGYFDLNNDYYLMLVIGDVKESDRGSYKLGKHKKIPWMSEGVVDFNRNITYDLYKLNGPLVKLHGIMMTLVWLLFVIVGMVTARYNREMIPGKKLCGNDVWFQVHRGAMVAAVVFAIIGFIPIYVEIQGFSKQILEGNVGVEAHPALGIIVTILLFVNPIMTLFRPDPEHKLRWVFNWAHRAVGAVAQILAITTVFIGFRLERAMLSNNVVYVTIAHLVIVTIICVFLEIHKRIQKTSLPKLPFILLVLLGIVALIFELFIIVLIATS